MNKSLTPAQQKLVEDNHNLIYSFMNSRNLSFNAIEDWYGTLAIGLCYAAMSFDENRGIAFSTYAYKCMENEINQVRNARKREPEVAYSLEDLVRADGDTTHEELVGRWTDIDVKPIFEETVNKAFACLTPTQKRIVMLVFNEGYSGIEAAAKLGVTPQRVSSVCRKFRRIIKQADEIF